MFVCVEEGDVLRRHTNLIHSTFLTPMLQKGMNVGALDSTGYFGTSPAILVEMNSAIFNFGPRGGTAEIAVSDVLNNLACCTSVQLHEQHIQ